MSTYEEINQFLSQFNTNSYNREQIGNNKQLIIKIFEYITKFNVYKKQEETIINNIAYLKKDSLNIPIYLELLSKSIGYLDKYKLKDVINVVKQVHDIYNEFAPKVELDEYIHATDDEKTRKLFLTLNNKYINRTFTQEAVLPYVSNLKFALAIELNSKEYQDFINYIDNFEDFQNTYSPIIINQTYLKVRENLKESSKLFWDLFFGNEYMVALVKNNIQIKDIHNKPTNTKQKGSKRKNHYEQLQLDFSESLSKFQISDIFTRKKIILIKKVNKYLY